MVAVYRQIVKRLRKPRGADNDDGGYGLLLANHSTPRNMPVQ